MAENPQAEKPPVVVFAFNRPDKLRRVLAALKREGLPSLGRLCRRAARCSRPAWGAGLPGAGPERGLDGDRASF